MKINDNFERCKVCQANEWELIDTLSSGVWDQSKSELNREELKFPIGCCQQCKHVQVLSKYTEHVFSLLYFSNSLEPDMWCDTPVGQLSPYDEMIEFFSNKIKINQNIVDFGCGAGITLKAINEKYKSLNLTLTGVDFSNHVKSHEINHLCWDVNQLDKIDNKYWINKIDLAISSHVLEHVIDPVAFLTNIANQLSEDGHIFIEVPDCSSNSIQKDSVFTNLVHGQHIHYYTQDSLKLISKLAGLKVLNISQLQTNVIPRLQILLAKEDKKNLNIQLQVNDSARQVVEEMLAGKRLLRKRFIEQIKFQFKKEEKIGVWGIGGDFYLLTKEYPEVIDFIKQQKLVMFDLDLSGHSYLGQKINSSSEIKNIKSPVFITPTYAPTREKMFVVSKSWTTNIIDPYKPIKA